MSAVVYVTNVEVLSNPAAVTEPFCFKIWFESLQPLPQDLEWRLIYVASATDKSQDQELDSVTLGPITRGALQFTFVADAPDFSKIAKDEIPGMTVILLSGSYNHHEFVRVGWYLQNLFKDVPLEEQDDIDVDQMSLDALLPRLQRVILADNPRVTRFNIEWEEPPAFSATEPLASPGTDESKMNADLDRATMSDNTTEAAISSATGEPQLQQQQLEELLPDQAHVFENKIRSVFIHPTMGDDEGEDDVENNVKNNAVISC